MGQQDPCLSVLAPGGGEHEDLWTDEPTQIGIAIGEEGHGRVRFFGAWRFFIRFAAPLAVGAIIVSVILGAEYQ